MKTKFQYRLCFYFTSFLISVLSNYSFARQYSWVVGDGGVTLRTINGGSICTREGRSLSTQNLTKVDVVFSTEVYIVGNGRTFIKHTEDFNQGNTAQLSNISVKLSSVASTFKMVDLNGLQTDIHLLSVSTVDAVFSHIYYKK